MSDEEEMRQRVERAESELSELITRIKPTMVKHSEIKSNPMYIFMDVVLFPSISTSLFFF